MKVYNFIYYAGLAWFAGFMIWAATAYQDAGFWPFMAILAVAAGPCGALWVYRRITTGKWIS